MIRDSAVLNNRLVLILGWFCAVPFPGVSQLSVSPPIVLGVSNVQSGPSRSLGTKLVQGSRAYFDSFNQAGGVNGRKITLIVKDDKYEPDPAIQNTNDLIVKDDAFLLFDYVGTPTLSRILPLLAYYKDRHIVNVAPLTGAEIQRKLPYSQYVFNIRASYREEAQSLVNYLYAKGFRRIGFLGQADSYGKNGQVAVEEALRKFGLTIVASAAYRRNAELNSMQPQVAYLRDQAVDAIIAVGTYGPCSKFIRDARLSHWEVPIANLSFVDADSLLTELRAASRAAHVDLTSNLINSQVVPPPGNSECPLVRAYLASLGSGNAGFTSLEGWLNAAVLAEALKRAGRNASRADFTAAMESLNGWDPGIGYKLAFSNSEHQGLHKVWLTRTEKQEWILAQNQQGGN